MRRVAVLAVVLLSLSAAGGVVASPGEQEVSVRATEFKFTPNRITLRRGVKTELVIRNTGKVDHEFMVYARPAAAPKDWDEYIAANTYFRDMGEVEVVFGGVGAAAGTRIFEVELKPGKSATIEFTPTRTGTFELACHTPGHYEAGMKGVFTVK